jgi:Resolvase, N terminal domain
VRKVLALIASIGGLSYMQEASRAVDLIRRGRAVEYVRMSTDRQEYSTANQRDMLASYAARRGFTVVRTYTDEGRSGTLWLAATVSWR